MLTRPTSAYCRAIPRAASPPPHNLRAEGTSSASTSPGALAAKKKRPTAWLHSFWKAPATPNTGTSTLPFPPTSTITQPDTSNFSNAGRLNSESKNILILHSIHLFVDPAPTNHLPAWPAWRRSFRGPNCTFDLCKGALVSCCSPTPSGSEVLAARPSFWTLPPTRFLHDLHSSPIGVARGDVTRSSIASQPWAARSAESCPLPPGHLPCAARHRHRPTQHPATSIIDRRLRSRPFRALRRMPAKLSTPAVPLEL